MKVTLAWIDHTQSQFEVHAVAGGQRPARKLNEVDGDIWHSCEFHRDNS
jgi:hypothetical protein